MMEVPQTLTVVIPLKVQRRGGRKAMLTPGGMALHAQQDITLIKAVARSFRWLRMLETGRFATITELAAAEKISASYVSRRLRLTFLAPEVVWRRGVSCREIIGQDTDAAWKDAFNERRFAGVLG